LIDLPDPICVISAGADWWILPSSIAAVTSSRCVWTRLRRLCQNDSYSLA